ncbi:MAG: glyoxylate/hydroxypyruvate reductase A [Rhodobacteraceae bacterium]|nr:glyoxylate/hydroxypyruvate reductase A [Paracoccaceae bacterium]
MALMLHSTPERGEIWGRIFNDADEAFFPSEAAVTDPTKITHIACWNLPADLDRYPNLATIICVGAGADHLRALPDGVRLVRTDIPSIAEMVRDWVVMATLALHRDMPVYLDQATRGLWRGVPTRRTRSCRVGIMGMGRIGALAASSLAALGFDVAGFSRSGHPIEGFQIYGADDLDAFLARTDMLICLLPLTDSTRHILGDALFARLPPNAQLVHAGRGAHLDMDAVQRALNNGQLRAAMLDVADPEPLPADHWVWADPRVIITPHVAAHTDAEEGAQFALQVVRAERSGMTPPGLVDIAKGY